MSRSLHQRMADTATPVFRADEEFCHETGRIRSLFEIIRLPGKAFWESTINTQSSQKVQPTIGKRQLQPLTRMTKEAIEPAPHR